ncbi:histidine kinase [Clostridium novyi A str. 4570]|uniref:Stage 0 sporulation protein A homolog n=1 Tax=Clostridium novyi A str. 4570 TaxID=1444290 RepID=A0AA88ZRW4_CLONO|nr:PAS domain-containing hybrid sensor histidine kinase/response regulator [Clostridium novyi]KGN03251.1 histidine kinase [Clostridium novyi A str. 4570]
MDYKEICFSLLNSLETPIVIIDNNYKIKNINENGVKILKKLNPINLNIKNSLDLKFPYEIQILINEFINSDLTEFITEKMFFINNEPYYLNLKLNKVVSCSKLSNKILISITNITEQKKAEKILQENTLELKTLFKVLPDTYLKVNKNGTLISFINNNDNNDLMYTSQKFIGENLATFIPYKLSLKFKSAILKSIKTKSIIVFEYKVKTINNITNFFEARLLPLSDDEVICIVRNVTQKKQTEEELLKMEKLNSISTLAGGVAHDFNNILTIILGNISLIKTNFNTENKLYEKLITIEKIILQAKDLTKQLLSFSKSSNPVKKICYIGDLIQETTNLSLSGSNVCEKSYIAEDLWPVEVDVSQINQVLSNLIINSCQAMPNGGVLTVRCKNMTLKENEIIGLPKGKYVNISIKDQGYGISEENLLKVFDPYFTTKDTGMGLGLFSAYSIIKNHNGHISVKSRVGKGTIFQIYLPACNMIPIEIKAPTPKIFHGKSRILIMDDDDGILDILKSMLNYLGHTTEVSKDGNEAISLYKKSLKDNNPFDAVIMDLTIPGGMGGEETIKHLLKIDPNVKAIVSSGYYSKGVISNYKEHGFKGVINKPYTIEELSTELNKILKQ